MVEYKIRNLNDEIISSKDIKSILPNKCPYCNKRLKALDKRHLNSCQSYQKYLEKTKNYQKNIREFSEQITRLSIEIVLIHPNSWNVNSMNEIDFEGLKESIRNTKGEYLKKNPIQVRKIKDDYYEIIDGEHRWKACKALGYTHIPVVIENDIDIENSKVMNVIYSRNRGKIDYFKLSKLLNEEYLDENGKRKCTQQELAKKFGLGNQRRITHILKIYPRLKIFENEIRASAYFENKHLEEIANCKNDLLREKLIEQSIKNEWNSKEIRKQTTKFNRIAKFLNNELDNETKKCVLNIFIGNSIFELSFDELIEKIFKMTIENHNLKLINRYNSIWEKHNRTAVKIMETYDKEHGKSYSKGRYIEGYCNHPAFKLWEKDVFNFFERYYKKDIRCFKDNTKLKLEKNFIPHHEEYIWDFICYVFYDVEQIVFPCCNKCHQKGTSDKWE